MAGPPGRRGTAPSSSLACGGTCASAPGTSRSAAPAVRPGTSARTPAPGTRPDGAAPPAPAATRRSPRCSGQLASAGQSSSSTARRPWCRARWPGSHQPGTACGPAAGARRAATAHGSPDPTPLRPGMAGPASRSGEPLARQARSRPARRGTRSACRQPVMPPARPRRRSPGHPRLLARAGHRINGGPQPTRVRVQIHL